jgi:hypothetical protein
MRRDVTRSRVAGGDAMSREAAEATIRELKPQIKQLTELLTDRRSPFESLVMMSVAALLSRVLCDSVNEHTKDQLREGSDGYVNFDLDRIEEVQRAGDAFEQAQHQIFTTIGGLSRTVADTVLEVGAEKVKHANAN